MIGVSQNTGYKMGKISRCNIEYIVIKKLYYMGKVIKLFPKFNRHELAKTLFVAMIWHSPYRALKGNGCSKIFGSARQPRLHYIAKKTSLCATNPNKPPSLLQCTAK